MKNLQPGKWYKMDQLRSLYADTDLICHLGWVQPQEMFMYVSSKIAGGNPSWTGQHFIYIGYKDIFALCHLRNYCDLPENFCFEEVIMEEAAMGV